MYVVYVIRMLRKLFPECSVTGLDDGSKAVDYFTHLAKNGKEEQSDEIYTRVDCIFLDNIMLTMNGPETGEGKFASPLVH